MAKSGAKPGSSRQPEILQDPQKAAVFLLALEPEAAVQVLTHLRDEEIEKLIQHILETDQVTLAQVKAVLEEARDLALAHAYVKKGGLGYARALLEQALGPERTEEVLSRVKSLSEEPPFAFLYHADPAHIASVLQQEQPQTVALVLAHLPPHQAAAVLGHLPGELQAELAVRIAQMERIPQQLVREIEAVLRRKMSAVMGEDGKPAGGLEAVVELLHHVDRTTERRILEQVESTDPELAEAIRQRMFLFEDLVHLDDRSLQRVLREVDMNDLARALKIASSELREKVFRNVSQRVRRMVEEEMGCIDESEPDYRAKAEQAQQNIVRVVRRLQENEQMVAPRRKKKDEVNV